MAGADGAMLQRDKKRPVALEIASHAVALNAFSEWFSRSAHRHKKERQDREASPLND